jgi:hypothetical protein
MNAELTIKIPQELIDKYRYSEVEYSDWHDYVVDIFKETHLPEERGIDYELELNPASKRKLEFDIYHRQCYFPITVRDWRSFLAHEDLEDQYPTVLRYHAWGAGNDIVFSTENRSNHYYFSVEYDEGYVGFDWNDALDEFTITTLNTWLYAEIDELKDYVEALCKKLYQQLIEDLAAEYDSLTDDGTVIDSIHHNYLDNDELETWCLEHQGNIVWTSQPIGASQ